MKKLLILLPVLVIAFCVAGCIFSDNDKKADDWTKALIGTWGTSDYSSGYSTITFSAYDQETRKGQFVRSDYVINKDGSRTQTWTGFGQFKVELKSDGYSKDGISFNNWDESGRLTSTTYYSFSISGNKLTLVATGGGKLVYTKE